jgi:hypothetical protein
MKTNTRILYTILLSTIGISAIKYAYFYSKGRSEMDLKFEDYSIIGASSGAFISQVAIGGLNYLLLFASMGLFYGLFYCSLQRYFVKRKTKLAEKIGITL